MPRFKGENSGHMDMLKYAIEDIVEALAIIHDKITAHMRSDNSESEKRLTAIIENFKKEMGLDFKNK